MIAVPDTALARTAERIVVACSPTGLVNHCRRTYQFGGALLARAGRAYDQEVLYVASLLHDLGLTDSYEDGTTSFEQRGAQVAAAELAAAGADEALVALVREAIALHLSVAAADDPRPEVAGVSIGAAVDVLGLRLDKLPPDLVAGVLEEFPRGDFKQLLVRAIERQVGLKPDSTIAGHVRTYGFVDLVAAAPFAS
jgi:hypothetical protein